MSARRKRDIVEQLENTCPHCGDEFDAVEFGAPCQWGAAGHIGPDKRCEVFTREACFYHGIDDETINKYGLTPATDQTDDSEYEATFVTGTNYIELCERNMDHIEEMERRRAGDSE